MVDPARRSRLREARALRERKDWEALAALAAELPAELDGDSAALADEVAFALGQLRRFDAGIELLERAWRVEGTYRRASALAYLHYSASMELRVPARARERGAGLQPARERHREGFRAWIAEALRLGGGSVKDLYRLGIFEAQVESLHDKVALRAFLAALRAYSNLDDATRERRHDLRKYFVRSLYAGARSALRLGQVKLARKLCFSCIREDGERDHVERVHKLGLAAKICVTSGELDAAERAVRQALDAPGPPRREHLHLLMAEILRRRGQLDAAVAWIDRSVRPHHRSAAAWRALGDLHVERADDAAAERAFRSCLERDRLGRHLTLVRIGDLARRRGDLRAATTAYQKALQFRRRRYSSDDPVALARLAELAELGAGPGLARATPGATSDESEVA